MPFRTPIMHDAIQNAAETARQKLGELLAERQRIDAQIIDWKRVLDSLSAVSESVTPDVPSNVVPNNPMRTLLPNLTSLGFTDAIRWVLKTAAPNCLTPPGIRHELLNMGFDFSKYKQELVPVHNTLKRLEEQGEVESVKAG
jgi:hypothetical protein